MSKSSPITITSEELRDRVEEYLDRWIPDDVWNRSEPYARRKLDLCREREPEVEYYNNEYLVLLAADTVRETEFSDFTLADYEAYLPTIVTTNYDADTLIRRMTTRDTRDDTTARATIDRLMEMCRAIALTGESWRQK